MYNRNCTPTWPLSGSLKISHIYNRNCTPTLSLSGSLPLIFTEKSKEHIYKRGLERDHWPSSMAVPETEENKKGKLPLKK